MAPFFAPMIALTLCLAVMIAFVAHDTADSR